MRRIKRKWNCPFYFSGLLPLLLMLAAPSARAGLLIENNLFYLSNNLKTTSSDSMSGMLLGFFAGATIPKYYFIGWNVNVINRGVTDASGTAKLSGTEMGPRVGAFLGRQQYWSVALGYNPLVKATYTPVGGSAVSLQGSGFQFELGFSPQITKTLYAGMKIVYDSASYSSQTDATDKTTTVSFSQSTIVPVIYLSWRF